MSKPKFEIDDAVKIGYGSKVYYVQQIEQDSNGFWAYALKSADGSTPRTVESMLSKASLLDDKAIKAKTVCFGQALEALKRGKKVFREGWNGKNMWLVHIQPMLMMTVYPDYSNKSDEQVQLPSLPYIGMKTADDKFVPWLASQTDMLACDWCIMGEEEKRPYPDRIPVPENIKFYRWDVWSCEGNKGTLWGLCSPNKKLALFTKGNVPSIDSILNTYRVTAYLIPCKRSDLKPGDIAFRAIAGVPNGVQDFTIHHQYCVILNEDESAYWYNEMDMKVDVICGGIFWYKVIFE